MKNKKAQVRNGILIVDGKPIDTFEKLLTSLYDTFGKEYADQLLAEAYHMYVTDPEGAAKAEEELRNENYDIN